MKRYLKERADTDLGYASCACVQTCARVRACWGHVCPCATIWWCSWNQNASSHYIL